MQVRRFAAFVGFGVWWVAVQTFWVSVVWRADVVGYVMEVLIVDVTFAATMGGLAVALRRLRAADVVLYLIAGALGLTVIEWGIAGNLPGSEANQFVMFTTWAGVAGFARLATATEPELACLRRWGIRVFAWFGSVVTVAGLVLMVVAPGLAFAVTFLAANIGYPLLIPLFVALAVVRWRLATSPQTVGKL